MAVAAFALSRLLWEQVYIKDHGALAKEERPRMKEERIVAPTHLIDAVTGTLSEQSGVHVPAILALKAWLSEPQRSWFSKESDESSFNLQLLRPSILLAAWLAGDAPSIGQLRADTEYMMWRNVRVRHRCRYSADTVRVFQTLADELSRIPRGKPFAFTSELQAPLESALQGEQAFADSAAESVSLFLECCRLVSYIEPRYTLGKVVVQADSVDPDFLLTKLFGFPTNIQGFDGLFGGGGMIFAERVANDYTTRGRLILIRGQFGAGKSSLALALASEIARKPGGLSWVVPLEQTADECRQCLQATSAPGPAGAQVIFDNVDAVLKDVKPDLTATTNPDELAVTPETDERALVILSSPKNDIGRMLERVASHARETRRYPLRLWVVDPINSIVGLDTGGAELRDQLVRTVAEIKDLGANLILVAESDNTEQRGIDMLANVADVVIDLTTESRHGYSQRFLEVKKSRLQREQRGQHPFSIKQGTGIAVLLSSAAVKAKIRSRRVKQRPHEPRFGWSDLDEQLGPGGLWTDDIVVVRGDEGTPRAQIGHLFLLGSNHVTKNANQCVSLLVSIESDERALKRQFDPGSRHPQRGMRQAEQLKGDKQIKYLALPAGFIQPGTVFQRLEQRIERLQREGKLVDRLVFDRVQQLEFGCPFIRDDETFGKTLVDFLRHRHISALFVCGPQDSYQEGYLQKTLENEAGVLISLGRAEYRNIQRETLQIVKTRSMKHSREKFDVEFSDEALTLKPSLIRDDRIAETRLYLHAENDSHKLYHKQLETTLQGIVAREVHVISEDRTRIGGMANLGALSAIDELQIWQVDEYQLPRLLGQRGDRRLLRSFPASRWGWPADNKARVEVPHSEGDFAAVPFYNNVSMLALHHDNRLADASRSSWEDIASASWHHANSAKSQEKRGPYFGCPLETDEDYNCFFLELLLGTGIPRSALVSSFDRIAPDDLVHALALFQVLCHYQCAIRPEDRATHCPRVARHWYTSFFDFSSRLPAEERQNFKLSALPTPKGEPNVAVAGEWYLAIPVFSAAPLLGLEIIRALTTRDEELHRMREGVGLPVSPDFYAPGGGLRSEGLARIDARELQLVHSLLRQAFRRSDMNQYATLSPILASHLRLVASMKPANGPPERWKLENLEPLRVVQESLTKSLEFSLARPPQPTF